MEFNLLHYSKQEDKCKEIHEMLKDRPELQIRAQGLYTKLGMNPSEQFQGNPQIDP